MAVQTRVWRDRWIQERNRSRSWFQVSPRRWVIRIMLFSATCGLLLVFATLTGLHRSGRRKRILAKGEKGLLGEKFDNAQAARGQKAIALEIHNASTGKVFSEDARPILASSESLRGSRVPRQPSPFGFTEAPRPHKKDSIPALAPDVRKDVLHVPKVNNTATTKDAPQRPTKLLAPLSTEPSAPRETRSFIPQTLAAGRPSQTELVQKSPSVRRAEPPVLPLQQQPVEAERAAIAQQPTDAPKQEAQRIPDHGSEQQGGGVQHYSVQAGDTMTAIAKKHHVPLSGLLAVNADSVPNPDQISVGQRLKIPTADDALILAGASRTYIQGLSAATGALQLGGGLGSCNYARNPSFEATVDDFGQPMPDEDSQRGRYAAEWKSLQAVVAGRHYEVDHGSSHSGSASIRMQGGGAHGGEVWKGFFQHVMVKQKRPGPLGISVWVAAEELSEGAGVYVDVELVACKARAEEEGGWGHYVGAAAREVGLDQGCGEKGEGWGTGARTGGELFVKDLTIAVPAGSYGWWPVGVRWEAVAGLRVRSVTVFVLLRGAAGALWLDDVGVWGVDESWDVASQKAMGVLGAVRSAIPGWWMEWPARVASMGLRSVAAFHRRATRSALPADVTAVTQLSTDRLPALGGMVRRWRGMVSAAVLVCRPEHRRQVEQWWVQTPGASDTVDVHVVEWEEGALNGGQLYPVNLLRNVAVQRARSEVVLLLDVDFAPFTAGRGAMAQAARRLLAAREPGADAGASRRVYVVPAFEQLQGSPEDLRALYEAAGSGEGEGALPRRRKLQAERPTGALAAMLGDVAGRQAGARSRTAGRTAGAAEQEGQWAAKARLRELHRKGVVGQVHGVKFAKAHGPTDYPRWFGSEAEYAVAYESEYEPYILCRKDIPPFDVRFSGYGADKSSHVYELSRSGHVLVVLPGAFLLHEAHPPAPWSAAQNWTRAWMDWTSFVADTNANYSPAPEAHQPHCASALAE